MFILFYPIKARMYYIIVFIKYCEHTLNHTSLKALDLARFDYNI